MNKKKQIVEFIKLFSAIEEAQPVQASSRGKEALVPVREASIASSAGRQGRGSVTAPKAALNRKMTKRSSIKSLASNADNNNSPANVGATAGAAQVVDSDEELENIPTWAKDIHPYIQSQFDKVFDAYK